MYDRYLTSSPVEWLLESSDPSINYLTEKLVSGNVGDKELYDSISQSGHIQKLVKDKNSRILGDIKNPDLFYRGTIWCFAEAVERGLSRDNPLVEETAGYIIDRFQLESGGFSLDWRPPVPVACRTGEMMRCLITAGYDSEAVKKGIGWIHENQRHDGGWLHCPLAGTCDTLKLTLFRRSGNGLSRENDRNVTSCFYATIACASALLLYPESRKDTINRAAEFFLRRKMFRSSRGTPIRPARGWNPDFRLPGYPVLCQYDILSGLTFVAGAGFFEDKRTGEAFNLIMQKQLINGSWKYENTATGMLFQHADDSGDAHRWMTLRVLRLLRLAEKTGRIPE